MARSLKVAGDRLTVSDANDLTRATRRHDRIAGAGSMGGFAIPSGARSAVIRDPARVCQAQNNTGADLPIYGVASIDSAIMDANNPLTQRVLSLAAVVAGDDGWFCVAAEPIAAGAVGPVYIYGACLALVSNPDNLDYCDITGAENYLTGKTDGSAQIIEGTFPDATPVPALIRFPIGGAGTTSSHPAKVTAVSTGTFTADLYDNGLGETATDTSISVTLLSGSMPTVGAQIVVFSDQNGTPDYYYQGASSGGGGAIPSAVAAGTSLATPMDGVTILNGQQVLLLQASSGHTPGLYTYNGSTFTSVSQPAQVLVGAGVTTSVNANLLFSFATATSTYNPVGYAWG